MAPRHVRIWYDAEGDYLEIIFEQQPGYFRETASDPVIEKADEEGNILGFSVLNVGPASAHRGRWPCNALERVGLIELVGAGQNQRPVAAYDRIHLAGDIALSRAAA